MRGYWEGGGTLLIVVDHPVGALDVVGSFETSLEAEVVANSIFPLLCLFGPEPSKVLTKPGVDILEGSLLEGGLDDSLSDESGVGVGRTDDGPLVHGPIHCKILSDG